MCLQDWQLGRLIRSRSTDIAIGTSTARILQRDKNRVAITFCNSSRTSVWLSPFRAAAPGTGFLLPGWGQLANLTGGSVLTGGGEVAAEVLTSANTVISANYTGTIDFAGVTFTEDAAQTVDTFLATMHRHFTLKDYGDLPMQDWHAVGDDGATTVTVIEYTLPEDILRLTPDQLRQRV